MQFQKRGLQTIAPCFKAGMCYAEEFDLPFGTPIPDLPPLFTIRNCFELFFDKIWPLIPVVDYASTVAEFNHLYHKQNLHAGQLQKAISPQVSWATTEPTFSSALCTTELILLPNSLHLLRAFSLLLFSFICFSFGTISPIASLTRHRRCLLLLSSFPL